MNHENLISVIVPVYQSRDYLDKCISSITSQTYTNIEIILVDDGSADGSSEICEAWSHRDSRIHVIHTEKSGVSLARNKGIDISQGQYISFVDSDDYIARSMLERLYEIIEKQHDVAECSYVRVSDDDYKFASCRGEVQHYDCEQALEGLIKGEAFCQIVWNKLYRRDVIGDIRFTDVTLNEDELFTYKVIGNAESLVRTDDRLYAYRQHDRSKMSTMGIEEMLNAVEMFLIRHQCIKKYHKRLTHVSAKSICFMCIYYAQFALRNAREKSYHREVIKLKDIYNGYTGEAKGENLKEKIWLKLASVSFEGTCRIRNLLKIGL